jgi:hypothetical protein
MRCFDEDILNLQIEYQKNKMYRLSDKYGISSPEVLEQSLVVDVLVNQAMQLRKGSGNSHHLAFSSSLSR